MQVDAGGAAAFAAVFDRVLVDAPCSGSARCGAIRTSAGGARRTTAALAAAQRDMLAHAAAVVGLAGDSSTHLLERAGGERGGRRRPSSADHPEFRPVALTGVDDAAPAIRALAAATTAAFLPRRPGTDWRPFSPPSSSVRYHSLQSSMALGRTRLGGGQVPAVDGGARGHLLSSARRSPCGSRIRAREVKVPELAGKTLNDATRVLDALGLSLRVERAAASTRRCRPGASSRRSPRPAAARAGARSVKVWISAGPRERARAAAARRDGADGADPPGAGGPRCRPVAGDPLGRLPAPTSSSRQDPPPARPRPPTSRCWSTAASDGATYVMPDLIGVNGDRAADVLRAGLPRRRRRLSSLPGLPPGVVVRQSPQAGFQVAPGDAISLEVSR